MNGCYETYNIQTCQQYDTIRIQRNNIQPRIVHQNYTRAGYAKVLAPSTTFSLLRDYWNRYSTTHLQFENNQGLMNDGSGTTSGSSGYNGKENADLHRNHWVAPTKVLYLDPPYSRRHRPSVSSTSLPLPPPPQMSMSNIHAMIDQVQSLLEQWAGVPLQFTSMYGIRAYTNHSILTPHVDRYVKEIIYILIKYVNTYLPDFECFS